MTFALARDAILLFLSLLGSGLSLFNFFDARAKNKRRIKVTMSSAVPTYTDGTLGLTYIRVEAANIGQRDVAVKSLYIEVSKGGNLTSFEASVFPGLRDTQLPTTLKDGSTAFRYYGYRDVAEALIESGRSGKQKITPVCEDTAGGIHRGEPWQIDPMEFRAM